MKKGKDATARELAEKLSADKGYQARLRAQAERAARIQSEEVELLRRLADRGYAASSLEELVECYAPLPGELAEALSEALAAVSEVALKDAVVRAIGTARAPFDVEPLVRLFEETTSESLRWTLANAFAELRPLGIRVWLLAALRNPAYGKAREMLALAVARTSPARDANPALLELLNAMPGHVALALAETGSAAELEALRNHEASAKGWARREINKAIRAIMRRT